MNIFVDIATDLIYSITIVYYFNYLLLFRLRKRFIPLVVLVNSLADFILIKNLQFDNSVYFVNFFLIICTVILFKNLHRGLSYAIVLEIIFLISDGLVFYTLMMIYKLPFVTPPTGAVDMVLGQTLINVVNITLASLCACHFKILQRKEVPKYYWMSFCLVPLISTFLLFHIFDVYMQSEVALNRSLVAVISIIVLNLVNIVLYTRIIEYYNFKLSNEIAESQLEMFLQKQDLLTATERSVFRVQHDLKNSLLPVRSALANRDYETAQCEIDKILQDMTIHYKVSNTQIDYIDDMINYKYRSSRNSDISFDLAFCTSGEWEFNYLDISKAIGIALDNSIEACENVEGTRFISIDLSSEKGMFVVKIANPKSNALIYEKFGKIVSTKNKIKHHGLGLDSIKKIVEALNGHFYIKSNDDMFTIALIFYAQNE